MTKAKSIIRFSAIFYLIAVGFFAWGFAAGNNKVFPWKQLTSVSEEVYSYFTFKDGPTKSTKEKLVLDHQEFLSRWDFQGFKQRDLNFQDNGYLLISRYSKEHSQVIVDLFSIAEEKVLHSWIPPLYEIFKASPDYSGDSNTFQSYRAQHPLLLKDGGLIFTSGEGPLVRINRCGELLWVINRHFHHSIEVDHSGNLIVPIVVETGRAETAFPIRDDGYAIVSLDGRVLAEYSVTKILLDNGYRGLIYGVGNFKSDRIHLNDAQPILQDAGGANIGDVALSSRHLSTVFLFNPQSGKIKWLKTGPWLAQHDINQLGDGKFSIFGNDIVIDNNETKKFANEEKTSNVYVYNPSNNEITAPYSKVMIEKQVATGSGGRSKILANGDVFVEELDRRRILRFSKGTLRWEYVNSISNDTEGAIHWSRYVTNDEIDLSFLENIKCN